MQAPPRRYLLPDIVGSLCNCASLDTLATFARTSREFHEPAIRAMWHTLSSFAPLIYTLPSEAWTHERGEAGWINLVRTGIIAHYKLLTSRRTKKPVRVLSPADCTRYVMYAALVEEVSGRQFHWRWGFEQSLTIPRLLITPEMWTALESVRPGCLPNLRLIHQHFPGPLSQPLHIFPGPSLARVSLDMKLRNTEDQQVPDGPDRNVMLTQFLKSLTSSSPHLCWIDLSLEHPPLDALSDALADALCALPKLADLSISVNLLQSRAWCHLSSLPMLKKLRCEGYLEHFPEEATLASLASHGSLFPALTLLVMKADRNEMCNTLIRTISSTTLAEVSFQITAPVDTVLFEALATLIGSHPSRAALRKVAIAWRPPELASIPLPAGAIKPFSTLSALESFILGGSGYSALDNDTAAYLARAWSQIRDVRFYAGRSLTMYPYQTTVTVEGLLPFALYCPKLVRLNIPVADIDIASVPALSSTLTLIDRVSNDVKYLGIGCPRLDQRAETSLAVYLSTLFPRLMHLNIQWPYINAPAGMTEHYVRLELLGQFVRAISGVKLQERNWRKQEAQGEGTQG